jgi:membrane-associated PAP2 superfamily phosphatase
VKFFFAFSALVRLAAVCLATGITAGVFLGIQLATL